MSMTKRTVSSWDTKEHRIEIGTSTEVKEWLLSKVAESKTVDLPVSVSDTVTYREWADQETAQAWVDFVTGLAAGKSYVVNFTIEDLT